MPVKVTWPEAPVQVTWAGPSATQAATHVATQVATLTKVASA